VCTLPGKTWANAKQPITSAVHSVEPILCAFGKNCSSLSVSNSNPILSIFNSHLPKMLFFNVLSSNLTFSKLSLSAISYSYDVIDPSSICRVFIAVSNCAKLIHSFIYLFKSDIRSMKDTKQTQRETETEKEREYTNMKIYTVN